MGLKTTLAAIVLVLNSWLAVAAAQEGVPPALPTGQVSQEDPTIAVPANITRPHWIERPGDGPPRRYYPRRAQVEGIEGFANLDCLVNEDGRLSCAVTAEEPEGFGFAEAALRMAAEFRMARNLDDGTPTAGGRYRLRIPFRIGDGPPAAAASDASGERALPWLERPSLDDYLRHYPARASSENVSGRATIDCVVQDNGRLSCTIESEEPAGYGFGEAALHVAESFRLSTLLEDGTSIVGGRVHPQIVFGRQE